MENPTKETLHLSEAEIVQHTPFETIVIGIAQGWVDNENWYYDSMNTITDGDKRYYFITFKNLSVDSQITSDLDIKKAFIPEMDDIFEGHQRYMDRHNNGKKYKGTYDLNQMKRDVEHVTESYNVRVLNIYTYHPDILPDQNNNYQPVQYDTSRINILFSFKDLDLEYQNLVTRTTEMAGYQSLLREKIQKGIPVIANKQ